MPQPSDFLGFWGIVAVGWFPTYVLAWIAVACNDGATAEAREEGMRLLLHAGVASVIAFGILLIGSLLHI